MSDKNVEIVRRIYESINAGDWAEQVIDLGGERVLVLSRQTARGKTSGLRFDREFGDLFTLRDGKVLRYVSYWDRAEALEAAGLSK